jgi:hypothetical protein
MHDRNGTELRVGDVVMIEARVTELYAGDDYCNVTLQSVHGRRPDGQKELISSVNTGVLVLIDRAPG